MRKLIILLSILALTIDSIEAQITSGVTTMVALDQIKEGLNDAVSSSLDRADYSLAKAAIEALGIIDAWEEANENLLNTAFDRLDQTSIDLFSNMSSLIQQFDSTAGGNLETARQITENANQISESIIGSEKRSFILRYSPMVINPSVSDSVLVRIRGVNLDKADPVVTLPNNKVITPTIVGPQEANFWIPLSSLNSVDNETEIHEIKIKHLTRDGTRFLFFPKYKDVNRTILISTLPSEVGTYTLNATRSYEREERRVHLTNMGKFEATNKTIEKMAKPPSGYRWDLRKGLDARPEFSIVSTGKGEKGRCKAIVWNGSNEHGIKGSARLDKIKQIKDFSIRWKSGYKHCGIQGPIYRHVPATSEIDEISGSLNWNQDMVIKLPKDVSKFTLVVKLYTGEERVITNTYSDNLLSVTKDSDNIIIRNKVPANIL